MYSNQCRLHIYLVQRIIRKLEYCSPIKGALYIKPFTKMYFKILLLFKKICIYLLNHVYQQNYGNHDYTIWKIEIYNPPFFFKTWHKLRNFVLKLCTKSANKRFWSPCLMNSTEFIVHCSGPQWRPVHKLYCPVRFVFNCTYHNFNYIFWLNLCFPNLHKRVVKTG